MKTRKTLSTPDGQLSYEVTGAGPAVLAIQGVGVIGSGWGPQADGLARQFTFITFDNRGIGGAIQESPAPATLKMAANRMLQVDA